MVMETHFTVTNNEGTGKLEIEDGPDLNKMPIGSGGGAGESGS